MPYNYDGHASGVAVAAAAIALTIASSMTVVSRVGTRVFIAHCFGIEDILIALSFAFAIALCVLTTVMTLDGLGTHAWQLQDPFKWLISLYHSLWLYYLAMFCTKFSILIQYNRIFPRKEFRYATYVLMCIIGAHTIWAFFSAIFTCVPVARFWNPYSPTGGCIPIAPLWYANAALNIITDIAIVLLPLPIFKALDLPPKQKIGLMMVFGVGTLVCIISIVRLPALHAALSGPDLPYDYPQTAIWNCAEVNIGIMCSCLPTLRALVSRFWPGAFSTRELKDITSTANAARFLEVESEAATSKDFSRSPSRSRGVESRSSERLAAVLGNREIVSHATYMRTDQNRLTATEEDLVHVTVPTAIPPHARVHVLTVVDDDGYGGQPVYHVPRPLQRHIGPPTSHQISSPIIEEDSYSYPSPNIGPPQIQYRRDDSSSGNRTMFRSLSTADEIAAMERAAAQLDQAVSRAASDESVNDTFNSDEVPPSYYYRQADELSKERWSPDGREVHPAQRFHPAQRMSDDAF